MIQHSKFYKNRPILLGYLAVNQQQTTLIKIWSRFHLILLSTDVLASRLHLDFSWRSQRNTRVRQTNFRPRSRSCKVNQQKELSKEVSITGKADRSSVLAAKLAPKMDLGQAEVIASEGISSLQGKVFTFRQWSDCMITDWYYLCSQLLLDSSHYVFAMESTNHSQ